MIKFCYCPKLFDDTMYFSKDYTNKEIEKILEENDLLINDKTILPVYHSIELSSDVKIKIEETIKNSPDSFKDCVLVYSYTPGIFTPNNNELSNNINDKLEKIIFFMSVRFSLWGELVKHGKLKTSEQKIKEIFIDEKSLNYKGESEIFKTFSFAFNNVCNGFPLFSIHKKTLDIRKYPSLQKTGYSHLRGFSKEGLCFILSLDKMNEKDAKQFSQMAGFSHADLKESFSRYPILIENLSTIYASFSRKIFGLKNKTVNFSSDNDLKKFIFSPDECLMASDGPSGFPKIFNFKVEKAKLPYIEFDYNDSSFIIKENEQSKIFKEIVKKKCFIEKLRECFNQDCKNLIKENKQDYYVLYLPRGGRKNPETSNSFLYEGESGKIKTALRYIRDKKNIKKYVFFSWNIGEKLYIAKIEYRMLWSYGNKEVSCLTDSKKSLCSVGIPNSKYATIYDCSAISIKNVFELLEKCKHTDYILDENKNIKEVNSVNIIIETDDSVSFGYFDDKRNKIIFKIQEWLKKLIKLDIDMKDVIENTIINGIKQ